MSYSDQRKFYHYYLVGNCININSSRHFQEGNVIHAYYGNRLLILFYRHHKKFIQVVKTNQLVIILLMIILKEITVAITSTIHHVMLKIQSNMIQKTNIKSQIKHSMILDSKKNKNLKEKSTTFHLMYKPMIHVLIHHN